MTSKLKIGLVFDGSLDRPDGVQQYVLTVGRWLAANSHEVHYLVGQSKRTDLSNLHSLARNINVRFNKNRLTIPLLAHLPAIRRLLSKEKFDVLHVQVPYSPALAGRVIKAAGHKTAIVGTFHILPHSNLATSGSHLLAQAVRGSLKRFDVISANSQASAVFAKKTFGANGPIIPLPLDLEKFYGAKPFPKYKTGRTVLFLGRLVERKGCQYLLRAVAYAVQSKTWPADTRVVICSDGPLRPKLEQFVRDHDLTKIVEFTGYISEADKPRYMASADVVVYPSTGGESFGIVLLEAMAASPGVVLAGNNPGYASVMAPRPESLFDPHDNVALAKKIVDALQNQATRDSANKWQRKYIRQFDISVVGNQILELYKQALHKRMS
jgi:phosphatidylinositol alpha-mannosyltransferase